MFFPSKGKSNEDVLDIFYRKGVINDGTTAMQS